MSTLTLRCLLLIAGLSMASCREQNHNYCDDVPHTNCMNLDASIDSPVLCASDQECAPEVCDLAGTRMCVQCTSSNPAPCTATTPVCSTENTCRGCTSHAECSSSVCLADGSCASEASVAYVAESGSGSDNSCTKLMPCRTLGMGLTTDRPYVKLAAGLVKDSQTTTIDGKSVTILADVGAKLDRDFDGPILVVQSSGAAGANVQIFDLEITGATGIPGGDGIRLTANGGTPSLGLTRVTIDGNQGLGVAAAGGSLTVSRSKFVGNQGGGISEMNGTFVVVGNIFFNNGGNTSLIGGISIGTSTNAVNRLEFNSFVLNTTADGVGPAVQCLVVAGTFNAKNNILSDNRTPTPQPDQFAGTCTHTFSIMTPGKVPTGSSGADPMFVNPAMGDLHIQSTSLARHAADPGSDLTGIAGRDLDGSLRVAPADIGAYEFNPSGARSRVDAVGPQR
jgi:hypothetical protein